MYIQRSFGKESTVTKQDKLRENLFFFLFILFLIQVLLLPVFIGVTYASKSQKPEHILTYGGGRLTWDENTAVGEDGAAELDLFQPAYENAQGDGDAIIAPGTGKESIIRLHNTEKRSVEYTATLSLVNEDNIPIDVSMTGKGFEDTNVPPKGKEKTVRAVHGTLPAGQMQEFDISWLWSYEGDDEKDTFFGSLSALGEEKTVKLRFTVTVSDNGEEYAPDHPETGDNTPLILYIVLMVISGSVLIYLAIGKKRRDDKKTTENT